MDKNTLEQISILHALGQFGLIEELKEKSDEEKKDENETENHEHTLFY